MRVAYLCDGFACMVCSKYCKHTFDISHAKNFKVLDKTLAVELTEEEKREKDDCSYDFDIIKEKFFNAFVEKVEK